MNYKRTMEDFILRQKLFARGDRLLLAVSGGMDSVVLCHLFRACSYSFSIAHCNFQLRGADSEADELFVRQLAVSLSVPHFSVRFNTSETVRERKISVQMAARMLRYEWLEKIRREIGFDLIATAHHLDDSMETVFLNMFRGTGVNGLTGIRARNGRIVRPLMCFYRKELEQYAKENHILYREDASNASTEYLRNIIRNQFLPGIENHFPAIRKVMAGNMERWKETSMMESAYSEQLKKKAWEVRGDEVYISIGKIRRFPFLRTLLYHWLYDAGFRQDVTDAIASSLDGEPGKQFLSASHRVVKDRRYLILSPLSSRHVTECLLERHETQVLVEGCRWDVSQEQAGDFVIPSEQDVHCLDAALLDFPLVFRRWRHGDYFYPLGMKRKKKKISNYLIDQKVSLPEKERTWVVESGKKIACLLNHRIDERFKVTPSTKEVLVMRMRK